MLIRNVSGPKSGRHVDDAGRLPGAEPALRRAESTSVGPFVGRLVDARRDCDRAVREAVVHQPRGGRVRLAGAELLARAGVLGDQEPVHGRLEVVRLVDRARALDRARVAVDQDRERRRPSSGRSGRAPSSRSGRWSSGPCCRRARRCRGRNRPCRRRSASRAACRRPCPRCARTGRRRCRSLQCSSTHCGPSMPTPFTRLPAGVRAAPDSRRPRPSARCRPGCARWRCSSAP